MAKTTRRTRYARALRHGVRLTRTGKGKVQVGKVIDALEKALKDAGDDYVTAFELAAALARKVDEGVDLSGLALPTTPPISLELLDGPVVFVIALGMVLGHRKRMKAKKEAEADPTDAEIDDAAGRLEAGGHPDIGELPDPG